MQRVKSLKKLASIQNLQELIAEWREPDSQFKWPSIADVKAFLNRHSPKANYFYFHLCYFVVAMLLGGVVIYLIEGCQYIDALFTSVSAMSETGLVSVDFSRFHIVSQVLVLGLMELGGGVLLSAVPPLLRLMHYRKRLRQTVIGSKLLQIYYRLCVLLVIIIVCYWAFFQLVPFLIYGLYIQFYDTARTIVVSRGVNIWWYALFLSGSSFNNAGFGLFNDSMIPFQLDSVIQNVGVIQIVAGNTLFPVFLRVIVYVCYRASSIRHGHLRKSITSKALRLLLAEPRHFYTHLYPLRETLLLTAAWISITGIEFGAFMKEWDNYQLLGNITTREKLLIMWYQTVSIRTAGINNVDIAALSVGHLVLYTLTMYISSYPLIVSLRASAARSSPGYTKQAKQLISRDIIWLYLAVVIIAYSADNNLAFESTSNNFLRLLLEISSAFGTVGLTVGYPGTVLAFSGLLKPVSKFIVCLVMLAGRHRGLPHSVDPAVNLSKQVEREMLEIRRMSIGKSDNDTELEVVERDVSTSNIAKRRKFGHVSTNVSFTQHGTIQEAASESEDREDDASIHSGGMIFSVCEGSHAPSIVGAVFDNRAFSDSPADQHTRPSSGNNTLPLAHKSKTFLRKLSSN